MIISHQHRFVYVKTRKTASTSIEIALSKYCGPADVITPITPNNQAERARLGYPGPQNQHLRAASGREVTLLHHAPVALAREILGDRGHEYFFFTFERNPFDRIISQYYWEVRPEPWPKGAEPFIPESVEDLLRNGSAELLSNWPLYSDGDTVAVDFVGRYENIEEDLQTISERIGLPERSRYPDCGPRRGSAGTSGTTGRCSPRWRGPWSRRCAGGSWTRSATPGRAAADYALFACESVYWVRRAKWGPPCRRRWPRPGI